MTEFQNLVYTVVRKIPKGETLTYQQVAQKIGRPKAYRAVGGALRKNFDTSIPCHRVVKSDGTLGSYNRGDERKRQLLKEEGYLK